MASRSAPSVGAKKLTIKVKSKPGLPPNYLESTWNALARALAAVREHRSADHNHQELYSMVEDLCLHKAGGDTYVRLYRNVEAYLSQHLASVWESSSHLGARPFLETFASLWSNYTEQMKAIRLIFTVLDRSPKCMMQTEVQPARSLWDMGLLLLRRQIEQNQDCQAKLVQSVLEVIEEERKFGSESIMFTAHQDVLRMMSSLEIYSTAFEPQFLRATTEYYIRESAERMQTLNVPDYLVACERRWNEEERRTVVYLAPSTRRPLRKAVEQATITAYAPSLIEKGLDQLLDDDARMSDLARMYRMFSVVGIQSLLMKGFATFLRARGMNLVMDDENTDLVGSLIAFKAKVDRMLKEAFEQDQAFVKAAREAFENFINAKENKPAELIAKYSDKCLRAVSATDSEEKLQKTMELFRYLHAKDVFEEFYKQALAKRLLLQTSSSDELEKMMISRLKSECGSSFTNKLEGMRRDMEMGRTLQSEWVRHQEMSAMNDPSASRNKQFETVVQVLSMGFWPTFPDSPARLPPNLAQEQDRFKSFYTQKHQGRVLHWVNSLSHCILKAQLPKGNRELEVSLFQALVLLQFNDGVKELSFKQIADSTGIAVEELARTIASLALAKKEMRILIRTAKGTTPALATGGSSESKGKDDDSSDEEDANMDKQGRDSAGPGGSSSGSGNRLPSLEDVYEVNTQWTSKKYRLKINQVQIKETKKENEEALKRVANDRQYQIDAAIVRIMKARKRLAHNLLVTELFKQLSFPAKPQDLKKRIESLIEREYLERDENDPNQYSYLA